MKRILTRWWWLLALSSSWAAAQGVPLAQDLQADAWRNRHVPVLLFFVSEGCPYCAAVENDYLAPMHRGGELTGKAIVRKIDIDQPLPMKDFSGAETTHRDFARRMRSTFTPTLRLYSYRGQELGEAIVGFNTPEFYGGRIAGAIDEARALLQRHNAGCRNRLAC